jgi:hypothetical protein
MWHMLSAPAHMTFVCIACVNAVSTRLRKSGDVTGPGSKATWRCSGASRPTHHLADLATKQGDSEPVSTLQYMRATVQPASQSRAGKAVGLARKCQLPLQDGCKINHCKLQTEETSFAKAFRKLSESSESLQVALLQHLLGATNHRTHQS